MEPMMTADIRRRAIQRLNQRPILVYPAYIKMTGSLEAGILMSHLFSCASVWKGNPFRKTDEQLTKECCLTDRQFRRAKTVIKKLPFIRVTRKGGYPSIYKIIAEATPHIIEQMNLEREAITNER